MYSNKLYTPLRYPGGKAIFAPFIANLMKENSLCEGHYLEPYAGGAAVALELLFHGVASHIHINDLDPAVFSFWKAVTLRPDRVLRLLHDTPITLDEWYKWRAVLRGEVEVDFVERGFATLFMNRTNRSGILKAGVIGGKSQDGSYKIDARFKKEVIAQRIQRIALHSSRISVYCKDALELLEQSSEFLPKRSLVYLDPPYYVKGQGLYRNYYKHADHVAIAEHLQSPKFNFPWVVSYDNASEIHEMYGVSRSMSYGLNYTAQQRYVGSEVMFFSREMKILETDFPKFKAAA